MVCAVGLGSLKWQSMVPEPMLFAILSIKRYFSWAWERSFRLPAGAISSTLKAAISIKKMPITLVLYMVGAFSISAVPLFNGFISKTMIVAAAGYSHRPLIELMLHLASVGTFLSVGLKLPWGVWFGTPDGSEDEIADVQDPPLNMQLGMGLGALLCIITGIFPQTLYKLLPYEVHFHPYAPSHVVASLQLLLLTLAGFCLYSNKLMAGKKSISLDTDWFYRTFGYALLLFCTYPLNRLRSLIQSAFADKTARAARLSKNPYALLEIIWYAIIGREKRWPNSCNAPTMKRTTGYRSALESVPP